MSADEESANFGKAAPGKLAILYDGSCELCRASLDGIRQFDNSGNMEPLDLQDEDMRAKFPDLKLETSARRVARGGRKRARLSRRSSNQRNTAPAARAQRLPRVPVVHPGLRVAGGPAVQANSGVAIRSRRARQVQGPGAAGALAAACSRSRAHAKLGARTRETFSHFQFARTARSKNSSRKSLPR